MTHSFSGSCHSKLKFSIVTPTFNSGTYLNQTIASVVLQQGNFDIEYIVVDNASTDNTLEIVESYRSCLDQLNNERKFGSLSITVVSRRDNSMYEAINRGFSMASGDVFAWLNSDDIYLPGALNTVACVFTELSEVKWLKGITSYIDERGESCSSGKCYLYAQEMIRRGLYGREAYFIQQDSVFWRSSLWSSTGGVGIDFKLAGDYDLWLKFARYEPLYSVKFPVSCFRRVKGQLSEDRLAYREEQQYIKNRDNLRIWLLRKFFSVLEPGFPDWLNFLLFRILCPFEPLYYIDGVPETITIKKSNKYVV